MYWMNGTSDSTFTSTFLQFIHNSSSCSSKKITLTIERNMDNIMIRVIYHQTMEVNNVHRLYGIYYDAK